MAERALHLTQDLIVQLCATDATWLERVTLEGAAPVPPHARLQVHAADPEATWQPEPAGASVYWAQLAWTSPRRASVVLPQGQGTVLLEPGTAAPLSMEIGVDPRDPDRGISSALRLCLALLLSVRGDLLLHASGVVIDDRAALLLGPSGAGKTTSARRLGREGALRIADDLAVVRWEGGACWVEPCRFDGAARLPGRQRRWPLAAAYEVRKGAAITRCVSDPAQRLSAWASSIFMPRPSPALAETFLTALSALRERVPLDVLEAAPRGPLLPAVREHLARLRGPPARL